MEASEELVGHLAEIRKRLIIVIAWFVLAMGTGLYIAPAILRYIRSQPAAVHIEWNVFSFTDGLFIYMKCAFIFAMFATLPLLLYHVWAFVRPGLTESEAKETFAYIPASLFLFVSGVAFSYYVVFPMMVQFMKKMNQSIGAVETYGIDRYFSFMFNIIFPLAVAFEMPVVVLFLTRIGVLTPERLKQVRKYAYLGLAITGSCISPPDFVSHLSVTIPLILLFELSVVVSGQYYRKLAAKPREQLT
ncbi:twin-arginine translocase subunit TatC [Paenibacillus doosanensis]|uniref:Sec-independent protein translocase protein TatC n=1 Tax=Paenibacillus konkukensis TaxID=2020716 RepID=A0ABY4RYT2_9BACL|nr:MULTISPECIES: twin-arginine translocase subunit TatC [Paenibacillus]MCS7458938.1 twin-arginine translocase subunit TatC [Paenibacillus doosanensis]UQZ86534.1 Sec-independent protein translocase protein TatCy [Paenibacillus konkukensis]